MLYFSLPNYFENNVINNFFQLLNKQNKDWFKTPVVFYNNSGQLPYLSWNGGINSNIGPGIYHYSMVDAARTSMLPTCINCANVLLEDYDFYDCQGQTMLEIFNNGSNILEISSIPFKEKIQEKFPNYRYKFSKSADLITEFTPEILEAIGNCEDILYIGIPDKYSYNLEWLKQLKQKSKCEITVNPICNCNCKTIDTCLLHEHQNQIDYSANQFLSQCNKCMDIFDFNSIITIETILNTYYKLGFSHFTFTHNYFKTADEWLSFYIQYFLKPEVHLEALKLFKATNGNI